MQGFGSLRDLLANYKCTYIREGTTSGMKTIYVEFDRNLYSGTTSI